MTCLPFNLIGPQRFLNFFLCVQRERSACAYAQSEQNLRWMRRLIWVFAWRLCSQPVDWGLTIFLWLGPPWFNYWFSFTLAHSRISHVYSSMFIIVINLIFMFSFWCIDWVRSLYANRIFLCIVTSGPRVKLASCKSALNPSVVYSTDRSKAVIPMLVLLFVALWFILRGDLFYVLPCVILYLCFSVLLALRLPRLGKRELILVFFVRLFDLCLFEFVGFPFHLVTGKGCGLWLWHSLDFLLSFLKEMLCPGTIWQTKMS